MGVHVSRIQSLELDKLGTSELLVRNITKKLRFPCLRTNKLVWLLIKNNNYMEKGPSSVPITSSVGKDFCVILQVTVKTVVGVDLL